MLKPIVGLGAFVVLLVSGQSASANCRAEVGGALPNMIGYVILFSSRGSGPSQPLMKSEFWGLSGPSDTYQLASFPIRFVGDAKETIESWDWDSYTGKPIVIRVLADGVAGQDFIWIVIREIFTSDSEYAEALAQYPEARRGTCGSYFSR